MRKEDIQKLLETTPGFDHENILALGDLKEGPYFGVSEEEIRKWPLSEQIAFEEAKQKWFAETRRHGLDGSVSPFAVGGSDAGTIYGYGYYPPSVLYEHKKYPTVYDAPATGEQKKLFDTGHRAEPYIRKSFELATGMKVFECEWQMANRKWPHCVANVDGILQDKEGRLGIYEGKCPQKFSSQEVWKEIRKRGNTPDCLDLVPMGYRMQVWFYLAVTGLSFAYICAGGWGFRDDDIAYVRIERLPEDEENAFMGGIEMFVKNTARGKRPSDVDYADKKRLLEEYSEMYSLKKLTEVPVKLPASAAPLIKTIKEAKLKRKEINDRVSELKKELGLKEVESSITAAEAALAEMMHTSKHAVAETPDGPVIITYDYGKKSFDKETCKEEYPDVFEKVWRSKKRAIDVS